MKRSRTLSSLILSGSMAAAVILTPQPAAAQFGGTPEQVAHQLELEKTYPKLQITDQFLRLSIPGYTMGQTVGVDVDSKGHMFVYSRTNPQGISRGGQAAMLFEFDQNYKFMKEWGPHNYAESFAHAVRVDKDDNVWIVDEGSGMVVKFDPEGQNVEWFGRTPEAIDYLETFLEHYGRGWGNQATREPHPVGRVGEFDRPTDVAWDTQGNIFVSDGYGNSRVVKISPGGKWLKEVGTFGTGQDQFRTPHGIAADDQNNIYVADRANRRIQVYNSDLNYERTITGVGMPWEVCVSKGSPQYLFTGDGTTGKIYKLSLDGKVLGWAQTSLGHGEDDTGDLVHAISCPTANLLYIGSASMWDVQKVTIQ
ncbi:MAG: peptidyl-alpha-hydroxyglycine alpha-amidating lyase family protein [Candidatus Acidiferrales bacterium]